MLSVELGLSAEFQRLRSCPFTQVGSGFDVSAAIYGTHTYTRFSPGNLAEALSAGDDPSVPNPDADGLSLKSPLERIASCVHGDGGWDAKRGVLRLPSSFRLLMGDVCGGSSTPSMVRKVMKGPRRIRHDKALPVSINVIRRVIPHGRLKAARRALFTRDISGASLAC